MLDVPRNEIITFADDKSGKYTEAPATGDVAETRQALHGQLIEFIAESDDALMEKFFAQGGLAEEEWRAGIHTAIQKQVFTPLFVTSAENNIGVARLMDFISKYASSPVDRPKVEATDADGNEVEVKLTDPDPVVYIFKTMSEAQFGELSFFRVYSGSVKFGSELLNTERRSTEKIGQIYMLNGKTRTSVPMLNAGDIGAVVKLKDTQTGNTLCSGKKPVTLPKVHVSQAEHSCRRSRAASRARKTRSRQGWRPCTTRIPTFLYMVDAELRQTIVSAQGELHLEVIADRLRRRYNVHVELMRAAGALPGDHQRPRAIPNTGTRSRPAAPASSRKCGCGSSPSRGIRGVEFTQSLSRPERRPRVRALGRERRHEGLRRGHCRRLSGGGCEDRFLRRQDAPRGFEGYRVSDRRLFRIQGSLCAWPGRVCWSRSTRWKSGSRTTAWAK